MSARISAAASSAAVALTVVWAAGCAGPLTTADGAASALRPTCRVAADGEHVLVEVGLELEGLLVSLGEGDDLAARANDGAPVPLLPAAGVLARYEVSLPGEAAAAVGWSRGGEPRRWVELPLPPEPVLSVTADPTPTLVWRTSATDAPAEELGLSLSAGCADAKGDRDVVEHEVKLAGGAIPVVDLFPLDREGSSRSGCGKIRVGATETRTVQLDGLGLARGAVCATSRTSTIDLDRPPLGSQ